MNRETFASGLHRFADRSRLLFPDGLDAWRDKVLAHPDTRRMAEEMREEADRFLLRPIPHLPWSLFRRFEKDGSRKPYETPYFEKRQRLTALAVTHLLHPDVAACRESLWDILWSVCSEYTWCLPAHLPREDPAVPEDPSHRLTDPATHVDLFAAETAFALAEILALTRDHMPKLIESRIRAEVRRRVLEPFLVGGPFGWEQARHNWSAVCAGSVGAAALYLLDDQAELEAVLAKALASLECFLDGYGADGACTEGYGYWAYGFGFFVYFADLLEKWTEGAVNLFAREKAAAIARFAQHCFMDGRKVVNFSDAQPEAVVDLGLFHYLHGRYPEIAVPAKELRGPFRPDHCGRWAPAIRSLAWYRPELEGAPWGEMSVWFPDAQWLLSRRRDGAHTFFFAAKGGHNDEPHNHNDVGHFILHGDGGTYLADMGCGLYTRDYFGPRRYEILCNSSLGHSVPVIAGQGQRAGSAYRAKVLRVETGRAEDVLVLDIAGAYAVPSLQSWVRTFVWRKSPSPHLVLEDEFAFAEAPGELIERFITPFLPVPAGSGRVILNGRLFVEYDAIFLEPRVQPFEFLAHDSKTETFYALDFAVRPMANTDAPSANPPREPGLSRTGPPDAGLPGSGLAQTGSPYAGRLRFRFSFVGPTDI
jgi:hypothetical protein